MARSTNPTFVVLVCFLWLAEAAAAASREADVVAKTRDSWLRGFKSEEVSIALSYYAPDAVFLQPTGERIEGVEAIRALYQKVVETFDTDLTQTSRSLDVSGALAFDSGEYEETLTNRAAGEKQHFRGQYLMVFRKA